MFISVYLQNQIYCLSNLIFIKSVVQNVGMGIYSITKTALLAMVKVLGLELASKGIRVNAINLGGFDTDMATKVRVDLRVFVISCTSCRSCKSCTSCRGVFRTWLNIKDGVFCENS